jgi:hypothetical protein
LSRSLQHDPQSVCDELKGSLPAGATQRFRGFCDNSFFAVSL